MKRLLTLLLLIPSLCLASQFTTNYNLEIPASGQRDWISIISNDIISIDSILKIISSEPSGVSSVSEGVASPLVINPTSGAVVITMLSADTTQAGYISALQFGKVNILSSDVNNLIVKTNILSNDTLVQDNKIQILSNDAVIQDNKLTILSNDSLTWKNDRVSTDAVLNTLRATTLSGDTLSVTDKYAFPTTAPTVNGSVISYDSSNGTLKWGTIVGGVGGGAVDSVAEGVPSPLVINPTTGAVLITMLSADTTQAGYIDAVQYGKINILSTDVGLLTTKVDIISTDSATQEVKLSILSNDTVTQEVKLSILSADASIQDGKLTIISNDVGDLKLKTTILSNDVGVIIPKVNNLSSDVGLLKSPTFNPNLTGSMLNFLAAVASSPDIGILSI